MNNTCDSTEWHTMFTMFSNPHCCVQHGRNLKREKWEDDNANNMNVKNQHYWAHITKAGAFTVTKGRKNKEQVDSLWDIFCHPSCPTIHYIFLHLHAEHTHFQWQEWQKANARLPLHNRKTHANISVNHWSTECFISWDKAEHALQEQKAPQNVMQSVTCVSCSLSFWEGCANNHNFWTAVLAAECMNWNVHWTMRISTALAENLKDVRFQLHRRVLMVHTKL